MPRHINAFALASLLVVGVAATPPAPVTAAGPAGPVAEWTFDEASGATAADSVGSLDGMLSGGVTRVTSGAKQGTGALAFDGVDGLVSIANDPILEPADSFTLVFWAKGVPGDPSTNHVIVSKGDFGCDRNGSYEVVEGSGQAYGVTTHTSLSGYSIPIASSRSSWDGAWHLLALAWDDTLDVVRVSMDGYEASWAATPPDEIEYHAPDYVDGLLRFGGPATSCPYRTGFAGQLDDVRLWNRALSHAEILAMLPTYPTTTTMRVETQNPWEAPTSDPKHAVFVDEKVLLAAEVTPPPAVSADVTWYGSKDGGPETVLGTKALIVNQGGPTFAGVFLDPGSLATGTWSIRASWPGAANWPASSSDPWALEVSRRPVSVSLTAAPGALLPGEGTTLRADATLPTPGAGLSVPGSIEFFETTGGTDVSLGSVALAYVGSGVNRASLALGSVTEGTHAYEARYAGSSSLASSDSAPLPVVAGKQASGPGAWFPVNPVLNSEHATLQMSVGTWRKDHSAGALPTPTGTLTVRTSPGNVLVGSVALGPDATAALQLPLYPKGTQAFTVAYSGDTNFDPSTSAPVSLTIAADTVQATGVGVQYATFYPYKDGYRDTVGIKGVRNEPIGVSIRIYSPSGKLLKSYTKSRATGGYTYTWSGRNSSGTMYAAGKYRVVQVLTDAAGTKKTVTSYTTISTKRLYTYSATYTKNTTQTTKKTTSWLVWSFTLPSATVYKGLTFSVYGKDGVASGGFGPHDYTACSSAYLTPDCVTRWKSFPVSPAWRSVTGSPSKDRNGRYVRLYAWGGYGATVVNSGRVKVTYAILR